MANMMLIRRENLRYALIGLVAIAVLLLLFSYVLRGWLRSDAPTEDLAEEAEQPAELVVSEDPEIEDLTGEKAEGDFFVDIRLRRERVRSQVVEMLREIVNNPNSAKEAREQAQQRLIDITKQMTWEAEAEQLLEAKGFSEVVVYLMTDNAVVMVDQEEIDEKQAAQVASVLVRVAEVGWEDVSIMTPSDREK